MPVVKSAKKRLPKPVRAKGKPGRKGSEENVREVVSFEKTKLQLTPTAKEAIESRIGFGFEQASMLLSTLTPAQLQVALLIGDGYKASEVGAHLKISPKTVDVHRQAIMGKLNVYRQSDIWRVVLADKFNPPIIKSKKEEAAAETAAE